MRANDLGLIIICAKFGQLGIRNRCCIAEAANGQVVSHFHYNTLLNTSI